MSTDTANDVAARENKKELEHQKDVSRQHSPDKIHVPAPVIKNNTDQKEKDKGEQTQKQETKT